jgi:hypothetical protein
MELCSLTEAFPDLQKPNSPSKEERRAARKKAKKCKGADLQYLKAQDDELPPAADTLKKLGELPAFTSYDDAFNDLSGSTVEGFKLPRLPASNTLFSNQGLPGYFGKGLEDEDDTSAKEGFSNMQTNGGDSFEYLFGGAGAQKAGSNDSTLPDPMLSDSWKPLTPAKTKTAFFQGQQGNGRPVERVDNRQAYEDMKKRPVVTPPKRELGEPDSMRNLMANQLKDLERRMNELTIKQPRDSKNEILLFVGTGVFLLLSFELMIRASRR